MASEITATFTLNIRKLDDDGTTVLIQETGQGQLVEDMDGSRGPTPGVLVATVMGTGGTQVSFANLSGPPGWAWFKHLGRADGSERQDGDFVTVGMHDPEDGKWWPMIELRPGMKVPLPLSRYLGQSADMTGPGTGTAGQGSTARILLIAYPVSQVVSVEAYDR